jgi:hypothetical protein
MKLSIAAINHFDPLCRERLHQWLEAQSSAHNGPPDFIAVEYDQQFFGQIKSQRGWIREEAQKEWPEASDFFLDTLAESLAFEADTHEAVFPGIETLWLDQGNTGIYKTGKEYATDRHNLINRGFLKDNLPKNPTEFNSTVLHEMSREAWNRSDHSRGEMLNAARDKDFTDLIQERLKSARHDWAIIIFGADHAGLYPGNMRIRLEECGINCEVSELRPEDKTT